MILDCYTAVNAYGGMYIYEVCEPFVAVHAGVVEWYFKVHKTHSFTTCWQGKLLTTQSGSFGAFQDLCCFILFDIYIYIYVCDLWIKNQSTRIQKCLTLLDVTGYDQSHCDKQRNDMTWVMDCMLEASRS